MSCAGWASRQTGSESWRAKRKLISAVRGENVVQLCGFRTLFQCCCEPHHALPFFSTDYCSNSRFQHPTATLLSLRPKHVSKPVEALQEQIAVCFAVLLLPRQVWTVSGRAGADRSTRPVVLCRLQQAGVALKPDERLD